MKKAHANSLVLVVELNRTRAVQIMSDIRELCPGGAIRHALDLSDAYNLSEHAQPDLVILGPDFARDPGLTMFLAMLSALAINWAVVVYDQPDERIPLERQVKHDVLKDFLGHRWGPRGAKRQQPTFHSQGSDVITAPRTRGAPRWKTVVIGASTGGIEALMEVLSQFPADGPPTVIVQHINATFLPGLADRMDRICAPSVRAAQASDVLRHGQVLLAPGQTQHLVISDDTGRCRLEDGPPLNGHRPSVDALFSSAARHLGENVVGVLLSGMGRDGAAGLLDIRNRGGWTIGQDKSTCVVYGMPRAASECGALREQLPLNLIRDAVLDAALLRNKKLHDA